MGDHVIRIYFATSNMHKVAEAQKILSKYGVYLEPVDVRKVEIQSESLEEIAIYAATEAYSKVGKPVIVEDSGIFVESLNGFPGPYSSYVYKTIGLKGILKLLENEENRRATFKAVVALALGKDDVRVFKGMVEGVIANEIRGCKGFGYDPIFIPVGSGGRTFAEMDIEEKNMFSHRARAFEALGAWILANKDKLIYILSK